MAKTRLKVKQQRAPKYKLCRICFREMANQGQIPGVKKSSW